MTEAAAEARYKLDVQVDAQLPSDQRPGVILWQRPTAGTQMRDRTVHVGIAQAIPRVPDVVGMTEDTAQARYKIDIRVVERVPSSQQPGVIVWQKPAAGTPMRERTVQVGIAQPIPRVPDVIGMTEDTAQARYKIDIRVAEQVPSDQQAGVIVWQKPAAGTPMRERTVKVGVARAILRVPNIVGMTEDAAETRYKIEVQATEQVPSDQQSNVIVWQKPAAGAVMRNRTIEVGVAQLIPRVPNIVGMTESAAEDQFRIDVQATEQVPSDQQAGVIVWQKPVAGAVMRDKTVRVGIARVIPRAPDVVGLSEDAAETRYKIEVQVAKQVPSDQPAGVIVWQKPEAGAMMYDKTIEVGIAQSTPRVPDIIGMTEDSAEAQYKIEVRVAEQVPSIQLPGVIMWQRPAAGTPMHDTIVEVGVARASLPGIWIAAALAGIAALAALLAWVKLRPSGHKPGKPGSGHFRIVTEKDRGSEEVTDDTTELTGPAISFRFATDPGEQTVSRTSKE